MKRRRLLLWLGASVIALVAIAFRARLKSAYFGVRRLIHGQRTVAQRLTEYEDSVRSRLRDDLVRTEVGWPPKRLALLAFKEERQLEAWVSADGRSFRLLRRYPIRGASGRLGPKLAEGDLQVPEGIYQIESLNPNSAFHLALRVNYPNAYDREMGSLDRRSQLGSDIMIHGSTASIGCLAMGDPASEELFVLAARTGLENVTIILSPVDFRRRDLPGGLGPMPGWTAELYGQVRKALAEFRD